MPASAIQGSAAVTHINTGTTTHNGSVPAGIIAGELLICHLNSVSSAVFTSTSGYTFLDSVGDANSNISTHVFYKIAGASETACDFTTNNTTRESISVFRVSGQDSSGYIGNFSKAGNSGGGTVTLASIDTVRNDELVMVFESSNNIDGFQLPSGFTTEFYDHSSSSTSRSGAMAYRTYASPSATGTVTITQETGTARVAGILLAIRPPVLPANPTGLTATLTTTGD